MMTDKEVLNRIATDFLVGNIVVRESFTAGREAQVHAGNSWRVCDDVEVFWCVVLEVAGKLLRYV